MQSSVSRNTVSVAYREWIHTQHGIFADLIPVMPMLTRYAVFALAPVVVTLVLGIAGAWIVSGFRQGKARSERAILAGLEIGGG